MELISHQPLPPSLKGFLLSRSLFPLGWIKVPGFLDLLAQRGWQGPARGGTVVAPAPRADSAAPFFLHVNFGSPAPSRLFSSVFCLF